MKPLLSVIIPAYNEVENYERTGLNDVYRFLKKSFVAFEVLLVDDGSTDDTLTLLHTFKKDKSEVIVMSEPHTGKAGAVKAGMLAAKGKFRLYTDFDQSTPIEEIGKMLPFFNRGYDFIIGSREVEGASRGKEPWYRHLMGKGFNFGVQLLAVRGIHDTQCGFKVMNELAATQLFPRLLVTLSPSKKAFTGAFDVELLFLARKMKLRIAEVPVLWKHVKSKRVSPIKDSIRMAWQVILIRWTYLIGRYA